MEKYCKKCNKKIIPRKHGHSNNFFCSWACFRLFNNPNWEIGKFNAHHGYIRIKCKNHPFSNYYGYVYEHRLVMEKHIGRYLNPKEIVHHINGNHSDNRIENLQIFKNNGLHMAYDNKINTWSKKYNTCIICNTTNFGHASKGMCKSCYMQKWHLNHPGK